MKYVPFSLFLNYCLPQEKPGEAGKTVLHMSTFSEYTAIYVSFSPQWDTKVDTLCVPKCCFLVLKVGFELRSPVSLTHCLSGTEHLSASIAFYMSPSILEQHS